MPYHAAEQRKNDPLDQRPLVGRGLDIPLLVEFGITHDAGGLDRESGHDRIDRPVPVLTSVSGVGKRLAGRIVLELKKNADALVIENQLYQNTPLQQTFSIINIALVNRQPRTLSLKSMIQCFIDHRFEVIRRRTMHLLREAKKRAHVLEGQRAQRCRRLLCPFDGTGDERRKREQDTGCAGLLGGETEVETRRGYAAGDVGRCAE